MKSVAMVALTGAALLSIGASAQAANLFIEGDIVRGAQAGAPGPACVLNGQFKHLEKVVWRFRVRDQNGNALDEKGLKSLVVELPDGQKMEAKYGGHPPGNASVDNFWTAIWIIPASYPNGSLTYKAVASNGSDTATWQPFLSKPSQLQVVDGAIEIKKPN
jgi:hypothetical protein